MKRKTFPFTSSLIWYNLKNNKIMKNENSNLVPGLLFGAAIGALTTYMIIKNKSSIKRGLENAGEKVKHGVHEFAEKAKNKAEEFGTKAREKMDEYQNKAAGATTSYTNDLKDQSKSKAY